MEHTGNSFVEVLFYWLAALPILAAILVWCYFWRQKQLVKRMMKLEQQIQSSNRIDKTISADIFLQEHPRMHNQEINEIVIRVEDLPPPPTYADAIMIGRHKICLPPPYQSTKLKPCKR